MEYRSRFLAEIFDRRNGTLSSITVSHISLYAIASLVAYLVLDWALADSGV